MATNKNSVLSGNHICRTRTDLGTRRVAHAYKIFIFYSSKQFIHFSLFLLDVGYSQENYLLDIDNLIEWKIYKPSVTLMTDNYLNFITEKRKKFKSRKIILRAQN